MKVINYDFENIGGLLQMIAIPPTSFLRIRKDYNTGLNYLELRNRYMPMILIYIMKIRK